MKKILLVFIFIPSLAFAQANGAINLNTPQVFPAPPTINSYTPSALHIDRTPSPKIFIRIVSNDANAQPMTFTYPDDCKSPDGLLPPVCANLDTELKY
jgi:hypothetical protein